jgi:hypothetical protein
MPTFKPEPLLEVLSTITSPVFCELVLELGGHSYVDEPYSIYQDRWKVIDGYLEERFSDRRDFKMIIRKGESQWWERFRCHAEECFPLLVRRGCIQFEKSCD